MEEEFQKVQGEVEKITGVKKKKSSSPFGISTGDNNRKQLEKIKVYGSIVCLVFFLLLFIRPSFLYVKADNNLDRKFSFFKLMLYSAILSVLIIIFYEFLEKRKFL